MLRGVLQEVDGSIIEGVPRLVPAQQWHLQPALKGDAALSTWARQDNTETAGHVVTQVVTPNSSCEVDRQQRTPPQDDAHTQQQQQHRTAATQNP